MTDEGGKGETPRDSKIFGLDLEQGRGGREGFLRRSKRRLKFGRLNIRIFFWGQTDIVVRREVTLP